MDFSGAQPTNESIKLPYRKSFPERLHEGSKITIKGTILFSSEHRSRFCVDFRSSSSNNDIAFHFNPRFEGEEYVVCNTMQNGSWGTEERKMVMPFENGRPFELCFLVQNSEFQVTVNGSFFLQYSHRVPYHHADILWINGCVQLSNISFQNTGFSPASPDPSAIIPPVVYPNTTIVRVWRESGCLKVAVNGQPLCEYKHRVNDLPAINTMEVGGDIQLPQVQT